MIVPPNAFDHFNNFWHFRSLIRHPDHTRQSNLQHLHHFLLNVGNLQQLHIKHFGGPLLPDHGVHPPHQVDDLVPTRGVNGGFPAARATGGANELIIADRPTSDMHPYCFEFRKMFEDFMFPWTSFPPVSPWTRAIPLAAPIAILSRVSQSKGPLFSPVLPAHKHTMEHFSDASLGEVVRNDELLVFGIVICSKLNHILVFYVPHELHLLLEFLLPDAHFLQPLHHHRDCVLQYRLISHPERSLPEHLSRGSQQVLQIEHVITTLEENQPIVGILAPRNRLLGRHIPLLQLPQERLLVLSSKTTNEQQKTES
nr:Os11g0107850 [Ipomoea batatas]